MPVTVVDDYPWGTARGNTCYACGAGRREIRDPRTFELRKERVVDLGMQIDFEGYLCICESCTREAARILGMVDDPLAGRYLEQLEAERTTSTAVRAELAEAWGLIDQLRRHDGRQAELAPAPDPEPVAGTRDAPAAPQATDQPRPRRPRAKDQLR